MGFVIDGDVLVKYEEENGVREVAIPEGVRKIGNEAFYFCSSLERIEIPEGVIEIGNDAFWWCISIKSIKIPKTVKKIKNGVFDGCSSLERIEIPEGVREIGKNAFYECCSLERIEIPEGVREIGKNMFLKCRSLKRIKLPETVKEIGECAFEFCRLLERIEIPDTVTEIGRNAFWGCSSLYIYYCGMPEVIMKKNKYAGYMIARGFVDKGEENYSEDVRKAYEELIRNEREKLYDVAVNDEKMIRYMCGKKMIPTEDTEKLLEMTEDIKVRAVLLEYVNKEFTEEEREKAFDKRFEI